MDAVSNEGGNEGGGDETRAMDGRDSTRLDGTRLDSTGLGVGVGRGDGVFGMRETMRETND